MAAPQGALSVWVSIATCLSAKLLLALQLLSGLQAHSKQSLLVAGQARCLHVAWTLISACSWEQADIDCCKTAKANSRHGEFMSAAVSFAKTWQPWHIE